MTCALEAHGRCDIETKLQRNAVEGFALTPEGCWGHALQISRAPRTGPAKFLSGDHQEFCCWLIPRPLGSWHGLECWTLCPLNGRVHLCPGLGSAAPSLQVLDWFSSLSLWNFQSYTTENLFISSNFQVNVLPILSHLSPPRVWEWWKDGG